MPVCIHTKQALYNPNYESGILNCLQIGRYKWSRRRMDQGMMIMIGCRNVNCFLLKHRTH